MTGTVRVVNKRKGGTQPGGDEVVIAIDRSNRTLGNAHFLKDVNDDDARRKVIELNARDLAADEKASGPMSKALQEIAGRVHAGERIALMCWCAPKPCHGDTYAKRITTLIANGWGTQ